MAKPDSYYTDEHGTHPKWDTQYQATFPIGTVLLFNGAGWTDNDTMTGWYKCDGNNGTPNLVNKFIRSEASSGNTGGADTHALTTGELASHNHGGSSGNTAPGTGNQSANHKHVTNIGSHGHYIYMDAPAGGYNTVLAYATTKANPVWNVVASTNIGNKTSGNQNASHSHTVNAHGHSISSTGSGTAHQNMPAYYSLIFIIRIS